MPVEMRSFNPKRDSDEIGALVKLAFGDWGGTGYADHLRKLGKSEWKNERCLVEDGRIVAYLAIRPKEMYIGQSLLRMAGIAAVCTHPSVRMKGYGRLLFDDTVQFMKKDGYDLSILYGIPNYYHKFGYEVVMARHFITVPQEEIPAQPPQLKRTAAVTKDMRAICALYNSMTCGRDGNCKRFGMGTRKGFFKLTDKRGRILAYAIWHPAEGTMLVNEAISVDACAAKELLRACRAIAWREGLDHLNIQMPHGYPVTDLLRGMNSIYHRGNTNRRGCMGRLINLTTLAREMHLEWSALLGRSEFASRSGRLALAVGGEVLRMNYSKGRVKTSVSTGKAASRVTPERFMQMVHGYRSIADLAGDCDVSFARSDVRLLEVLFPERNSFLFVPDHF